MSAHSSWLGGHRARPAGSAGFVQVKSRLRPDGHPSVKPCPGMSDPLGTLPRMEAAQQELPLPHWGGARKGAGRKRSSARPNVPHRPREQFRRGTLHVTMRLRKEVWNLRTHRCFRALKRAFVRGCERFGYRVVEFSVQGNHIHLVVETAAHEALSRAMQGLSIRIAKGLNAMMKRRGPVLARRYHARVLTTPEHARRVVRYVQNNYRKHMAQVGKVLPLTFVDPFASPRDDIELATPRTALLRGPPT